jgi:hypothetical protein
MTVRRKSMSMFCKYFTERSDSLCKHVLCLIVVLCWTKVDGSGRVTLQPMSVLMDLTRS